MTPVFISEVSSLVVSAAGNLSLGGFFLSSIVGSSYSLPANYGMIIFTLEFLNVHSTAVAYGVAKSGYYNIQTKIEFLRKNPKLALVGFYFIGAAALGITLKSWVLPAYFAIGIIAKFFGRRATHDDRSIVFAFLLLMFSFVLGMRLWPGIIFFGFILVVGVFYINKPNLPQPQLFRAKLDLLAYAMPLIIFTPFYILSWIGAADIKGELFWAAIYFPSLAVNDATVFIRTRLKSIPARDMSQFP